MLLQEMNLVLPTFKISTKLSDVDADSLRQAEQEFLEILGEKRSGTLLVKDIFHVLDGLTEEYLKTNRIACENGCSYCCRQLVCATLLEAEVIIDYLKRLPRATRREITRKAKKEAFRFYERNQAVLTLTSRWEDAGRHLRQSHHGKPCMFLNASGRCSIYPARPIDCRTAKTREQCGRIPEGEARPKDIRLFCDQIASNLITEEEERINGAAQVIPLIALPISKQFGEFFG